MAAAANIEDVFRALGDPTRRKIIERLSARPVSATALAEPLGITVTAVGQHIRVLERSGLVQSEKVGRVRTCRVRADGFAVIERWIDSQRILWQKRLDRLAQVLDEPE